jgi:anti-sigma B factor antagonist
LRMLDSSDLIVTVSQVHGLKMIEASGEIDMSGAEVFRDAIDLARQEPVTIVSLRDVTYIDSTGLGILVREHNRRRDKGGRLLLVLPSAFGPLKVFHITGLCDSIECFDDVGNAVRSATSEPAPPQVSL